MSTATIVLDLVRAREGDRIRRRIEITIVVSLILHAIAIYEWFPRTPLLTPGEDPAQPERAMTARLQPAQRSAPQPPTATMREAPPPPAVTPPPPRPRPPQARIRPAPPPPVMTSPVPAPPIPMPEPPRPPEPAPPVTAMRPPAPPPPMTGDLSAYIEQQRRARGQAGDVPATVESETARRDRAVAENLASLNTSTFGNAPQNGGGTFQIRTMDFQDAQFTFYGWNRDINRRSFQVIDVRRGDAPTINLAIVRKIISIIRDHEQGDFRWHSKRLGRDMTLSARAADTRELESFMMQEFFTDALQPR